MHTQKKVWIWHGATLAAAILAVLISIVGAALGGLAYTEVVKFSGETLIYSSGTLPSSPYPIYLNQAAFALAMVMPTDLSGLVGNVYRVWSLTAQPHTVTIPSTNQIATLGGAIGDGFVFEVISANRIVVWNAINVVFN